MSRPKTEPSRYRAFDEEALRASGWVAWWSDGARRAITGGSRGWKHYAIWVPFYWALAAWSGFSFFYVLAVCTTVICGGTYVRSRRAPKAPEPGPPG